MTLFKLDSATPKVKMSLCWFVVASVTPTQKWQSQTSYQTIRFSKAVHRISFLPCLLCTWAPVLALLSCPGGLLSGLLALTLLSESHV